MHHVSNDARSGCLSGKLLGLSEHMDDKGERIQASSDDILIDGWVQEYGNSSALALIYPNPASNHHKLIGPWEILN